MNYNIPYYGMMPIANAMSLPAKGASGGIFSKLLGGINFSSILNNTQKTLNLVNQAIPLVKQVNPLIKNAKTMFHVMNEFKKVDSTEPTKTYNNNSITDVNKNNTENSNKTTEVSNSVNTNMSDGGPVFFIN